MAQATPGLARHGSAGGHHHCGPFARCSNQVGYLPAHGRPVAARPAPSRPHGPRGPHEGLLRPARPAQSRAARASQMPYRAHPGPQAAADDLSLLWQKGSPAGGLCADVRRPQGLGDELRGPAAGSFGAGRRQWPRSSLGQRESPAAAHGDPGLSKPPIASSRAGLMRAGAPAALWGLGDSMNAPCARAFAPAAASPRPVVQPSGRAERDVASGRQARALGAAHSQTQPSSNALVGRAHNAKRARLSEALGVPPERTPGRPRGRYAPRVQSPLVRPKRETAADKVERLVGECGLAKPLSGDVVFDMYEEPNALLRDQGRRLAEQLDRSIDRRVAGAADTERLATALGWFSDFLRATGRVPFVDPDRLGGQVYNQKTLELFAEFIRQAPPKRGRRGGGHRVSSDTISGYVGAVKLAASRAQRRPIVSKDDQIRLPLAFKHMRKEQPPPGSGYSGESGGRALSRGLRDQHLRRIACLVDRKSRWGIQDWGVALTSKNLLLRGGEVGVCSGRAMDPRRVITLASVSFRSPCPESAGRPWLVVRVVSVKDTHARNAPVHLPIRRRQTLEAQPILGADPMDTYDALYLAWSARAAEVPPHLHGEAPLFVSRVDGVSVWTTDDTRRLAREYGQLAGIDPAAVGGKAFRIGGATDMRDALGDSSQYLIKQRGRWASDVAQVYQRALVRSHLDASVLMGSAAESRDMEEMVEGWAQPALF